MNPNTLLRITLIGCGHMGGALVTRWLNELPDMHVTIVAPRPPDARYTDHPNVTYMPDLSSVSIEAADLIILAVKPHICDEVCQTLRPLMTSSASCIISIAAGRTLDGLGANFDMAVPLARVMPNMPTAIGKGASIGVANSSVSDLQKQQIEILFTATGFFDWIDDEALMHDVTALSGSGPAYMYYITEALERAAMDKGLGPELARDLARHTVIGAAAMLDQNPLLPASTLRAQVTSKGGTTEAALKTLMDGRLDDILSEALDSAAEMSKNLNA